MITVITGNPNEVLTQLENLSTAQWIQRNFQASGGGISLTLSDDPATDFGITVTAPVNPTFEVVADNSVQAPAQIAAAIARGKKAGSIQTHGGLTYAVFCSDANIFF